VRWPAAGLIIAAMANRLNQIIAATAVLMVVCCVKPASALERVDAGFKIFQFPANAIPRIDGDPHDWDMVPEDYVIGSDQLGTDSPTQPRRKPDAKELDVRMKVGWVKGMNRLYFLYEATKSYWDFSTTGLEQDILEVVVDGSARGGPFIARFAPTSRPDGQGGPADLREAWYNFQGHHAQNYHIFTPAVGKDWCMAWGPQAAWIKKLPYANCAYNFNFKSGEGGKLIAEFMITPFDEAPAEGPEHAVESQLKENAVIGLCWAVLDHQDGSGKHAFWNLSPKHTMYGQASEMCAFKLMPLEPALVKGVEADWSFKVVDLDQRVVAFHDETAGKVTAWKWDFGDGQSSAEQNPVHTYAKKGQYVVVLDVEGPAGKSRRSKVWDVTLE
jgi:hypothetical protein